MANAIVGTVLGVSALAMGAVTAVALKTGRSYLLVRGESQWSAHDRAENPFGYWCGIAFNAAILAVLGGFAVSAFW